MGHYYSGSTCTKCQKTRCVCTSNLDRAPSKINKIPPDLKLAYIERRITSFVLAEKTGMNASYLRRALKRNPKQPPTKKPELIAARRAFRMSIAHKSAAEIANLAHVSPRTAQRIRKTAIKLQADTQSGANEPV